MKKHSCGAVVYTIMNGEICVVLGMEKGQWFPFKGTRELGETNEQAAIREIYEETCKTVSLKKIDLKCHFSTKRKHYHIGLAYASIVNLRAFKKNRRVLSKNTSQNWAFLEKNAIGIFPIKDIHAHAFHPITHKSVNYYLESLLKMNCELNLNLV